MSVTNEHEILRSNKASCRDLFGMIGFGTMNIGVYCPGTQEVKKGNFCVSNQLVAK